jgi:hypothetical protein
MSLKETLNRNYKQIVYLAVFLSLAIPLISPIGLPIPIDKMTLGVYNKVDSLKAGDVAVLGSNIGASIYAEIYPQYLAVLEHLFRKPGVKVLLVGHGMEAPIWTERALKELNAYARKQYGVDFVNLGYIAGEEAAVAGLCRDIHSLLKVDYGGRAISDLPMMASINTAKDFTIVIDFTASADSQYWLNQAYATYGTQVGFGLAANKVPDAYAYYMAGQIFGIIGSLTGAAQYEELIHKPGIAVTGMDAQSISHMLYIALMVLCNVMFVLQRRPKK